MNPAFFTAIAQSEAFDPNTAIHFMIDECRTQLDGKIPQVAILLAAIDVDHSFMLKAILKEWEGIHLVGCTTDGELSSQDGYAQDSALLILIGSDSVEFAAGVFSLPDGSLDQSHAAVEKAMATVSSDPVVGLMFSDGLTYDSEKVLDVFSHVLSGVPFLGGLAADGWKFSKTLQFYGDQILSQGTVFLVLCGTFEYGFGVGTGWKPVGEAGIVTRAFENTVYEIDYRPAMSFYHELLGENVVPSNEMPIAVYNADDQFRFLRTCFQDYDSQTGEIRYLGNIPQGYKVRLTIVDRDSIITGARDSMRNALAEFPRTVKPSLALCFSCSARRALLGSRTGEEMSTAQSIIGSAVPIAGFYTYGEISPPARGTDNQLHNESFTSLLLG